MKICSVILAGGKSTRMGTNKALLKLHGKTVIEHIVAELNKLSKKMMIITNEDNDYRFLQLPLFADRYIDKGPLAGIEAALYYGDADIYIFSACDMPFIHYQVYEYLLEQLEQFDAVVPLYNRQLHPLSGVYRKDILPIIEHQLTNDHLKIKHFFKHIRVNYIEDFNHIPKKIIEKHFFNMNYPEQYHQAKNI